MFLQAAWLLLVLSVFGAYLPLSASAEAESGIDGRRLLGHKRKHNYYKHHDNVQQVPPLRGALMYISKGSTWYGSPCTVTARHGDQTIAGLRTE